MMFPVALGIASTTSSFSQSFCTAGTQFCDEFISRVTFAGIDRTSGCGAQAGYTDYYAGTPCAVVVPGSSVPISVNVGPPASASDHVYVWVDWNGDHQFASANEYSALQVATDVIHHAGTIMVPPGLAPGFVRMRVRVSDGIAPGVACGQEMYGEVEDYRVAVGPSVSLALRVLLEGAYAPEQGLMRDTLRTSGLLPAAQPYSALGYAVQAADLGVAHSQVFAVSGDNAIVDWLLVELKSAPGGPTVASRTALLQRDGDIVETDGQSPLRLFAPAGAYFIAVRHRNHLGVLSSTAIALSSSATAIDFTNPSTATYGTNAQKLIGSKMVMWAGDATGDGTLKYSGSGNDRDPIILAVGGTTPNNVVSNVYDRRDTNLDGVIKYTGTGNDRDIILTNVGSTTPNNTRTQQLP